jgi:hypothetical protein
MATVVYSDDNCTASIEVRKATVMDGVRRQELAESEAKLLAAAGDVSATEMAMRIDIYPAMISCSKGTIAIAGKEIAWPPTFNVFGELPEDLGNAWFSECAQVNKSWFTPPVPDEKKVMATSI